MLLSERARKTLIGYNPISSLIITTRFHTVPYKITVSRAYVLIMASSDEDIKSFYRVLEESLARIHKKGIIIITGDHNAKIGGDNTNWRSVMGRYSYGDRNERGEHFLGFPVTRSLYTRNTRFEQKQQRKWI